MTRQLGVSLATALVGVLLLVFARSAYNAPTFDAMLYAAMAFLFLAVGLGGAMVAEGDARRVDNRTYVSRSLGGVLIVAMVAALLRGLRFPIPAFLLLAEAVLFALVTWEPPAPLRRNPNG